MTKIPDSVVWKGIKWWLKERHMKPSLLSHYAGYPELKILRGINGEPERLSSDFLHACVDALGLRSARARGYEDTADVLTDDECRDLLARPVLSPRQGALWP